MGDVYKRQDRRRNAQKQGEMVLCQLAPYKVADACTAEGTQHFHNAAAKQKGCLLYTSGWNVWPTPSSSFWWQP